MRHKRFHTATLRDLVKQFEVRNILLSAKLETLRPTIEMAQRVVPPRRLSRKQIIGAFITQLLVFAAVFSGGSEEPPSVDAVDPNDGNWES